MKRQQINSANNANQNYFTPLQTIDGDDNDEIVIEPSVKVIVPPITILKCKIEQVHEICRSLKIKDYSIRKISIGLKLFCSHKDDYHKVCVALKNNYQLEYFTYASKDEKPYKAVLLGLDKTDTSVVKNQLKSLGLKCIDVKMVTRPRDNYEQVIFIVYFERKTVTLKELRQNYSAINYIKVRWEYQKPNSAKLTQCHNCQMFGHGSSRCSVKTFCAHCAGNHPTKDCKATVVKCANCNGPHKSMSPECPSRETYKQIRQRYQPKRTGRTNQAVNNNQSYSDQFPNALNQPEMPTSSRQESNNTYAQQTKNANNDLFSVDELRNLTCELISKLKNCKSRAEQFGVITDLAFKFLY